MEKGGYFYLMSNEHNNVLYAGVTNELDRRVAEHKSRVDKKSFTYRYNCHKLVYYELLPTIEDAIEREKQIKNWRREWKIDLIKKDNPKWIDLAEEIGVDDELIDAVREMYGEKG